MMILKTFMICGLIIQCFLIASIVSAQEYAEYENDYAQDSIYYDYANKQVQPTFPGGGWVLAIDQAGKEMLWDSLISFFLSTLPSNFDTYLWTKQ